MLCICKDSPTANKDDHALIMRHSNNTKKYSPDNLFHQGTGL